MGAEQQLLQHLYDVLILGQSRPADPTPPALEPHFTPNQKFLQAAVAYVDAFLQKAPGTDQSQARSLALLCFQVQEQYGHGAIPHDPGQGGLGPTGSIETLTSSHAQLWHAAAATLLYAAIQAGDDALLAPARRWWRAEAALNHLTGWQTTWNLGGYQVIAPGARGGVRNPDDDKGSSPASQNSTRDLDYELLLTGKLATAPLQQLQSQYFLAPLLFLKLPPDQLAPLNAPGSGTPLAGAGGRQGPWATGDVPFLPAVLNVLRQGGQHAAWFDGLDALQPQLQAGVDGNGSWYKFFDDANPPLENGGPSPWPAPTQPPGPVQPYGAKQG